MNNDLVKELFEALEPYLQKLNLNGFEGILLVEASDPKMNACVIGKRIEISAAYYSRMEALIDAGNMTACSDLANTVHHEFCHIDVDNRIPYHMQHLNDAEVFPKGIAMRVIREFLACSLSHETMSIDLLKQQISTGIQAINELSSKRDIRSYCDIICDLAYLIGDCIHKPCGYFHIMCSCIEDEVVKELALDLESALSNLQKRLPIEKDSDIEQVCQIIRTSWNLFSKPQTNGRGGYWKLTRKGIVS